MARYISQKQAHEERARLRAARDQLKIALGALKDIAAARGCESPGCACCTPLDDHESWTEHCDVGNARVALKLIKERGSA